MTSTRSSREERRNSEFRQVFFWQLKSNRVLAAFYTFFLLVTMPVMHMVSGYTDARQYLSPQSAADFETTAEQLLNRFAISMANDLNMKVMVCLIPISMIFLICYGVSAFGFMHTRRSVDLFHALPVRRTPMLMGTFMAGLVYLYVPILMAMGLCEGVHLYYNIPQPFSVLLVGQMTLMSMLMLTAFYVTCLFFCVVSGTLLDAVISIGAMNLGWPMLMLCGCQCIAMTLPGFSYSLNKTVLLAFSPIIAAFLPFGKVSIDMIFYGMMNGDMDSVAQFYDTTLWEVLWWVALIVVFLLGSVFYYKHRKSECAEDHFSYPVIRGVLRFVVSAAAGLGLGLLVGELMDSNVAFLVGIVAGSAIAHVVSQAIWTHSFRRFWMTIPAYLFLLVCMGGFLYGMYADVIGFVHRLPDVSQVESMNFDLTSDIDGTKGSYLAKYNYMEAVNGEYDYLGMTSPTFTEEADIQMGLDYQSAVLKHISGPYLPFGKKSGDYNTSFYYHMADGRVYRRNYYIDLDETETRDIISAESAIVNGETYQGFSLFPTLNENDISGVEVTMGSDSGEYTASRYEFTAEERTQIWETFLSELNAPNFYMAVTYGYQRNYDTELPEATGETTAEPSATLCPNPAPKDRQEVESYFTRVDYGINFNSKLFADLPRDYQERIMDAVQKAGKDATPTYVGGLESMNIPECCPKTRQLIFELTKENSRVSNYVEEEVYEKWED